MRTIAKPYQSPQLTDIIQNIEEIDQPYLSNIAKHRDSTEGEIQKYTETLLDQGWAIKKKSEKDGRKRVYYLDHEKILKDYLRHTENLDTFDKLTELSQQQIEERFKKEITIQDTIAEAVSTALLEQIPN